MTDEQIKALSKEELKKKGPGIISIYEDLQVAEKRRKIVESGEVLPKYNRGKDIID